MSPRARQLILMGAASALAQNMPGICWAMQHGNVFFAGQFRDPHLMACEAKVCEVSGLSDTGFAEIGEAANAAEWEAEKN